VTLLEIDLADGKLLIGPPTRFPAMLRVVSDAQRAHSALFTVWQQREHSGTIRRSWSELFPGAPLPGHSDSQLQQQLQAALRSGRLNAVFVRKPRRALNAVKPDQQRDRVMHVALTNKTVLVAPKGQLPRDLAKESSKTTRADAVLRGIPPKHPLVNTIGQQASRVLPPALANGSRKELVQQLTRQLSSGQLDGAVLDQAEFVRRAASLPSAPKPVSRMSVKEKVYEALARSFDLCGGDLGAALKKLRDPHNLAMMVGFMLVLAGVQLIPGVDVVVDFGMLVWLLYTVGTKAVTGVNELVKAVSAAVDAKDDRQLDTAGRHFADAFEALGEAGISALLAFLQGLRLAGRFAKAGEAEAEAAAGAKAGKSGKSGASETSSKTTANAEESAEPAEKGVNATIARALSKADAQEYLMKRGVAEQTAKSYVDSFEGPITLRPVEKGETFLRYCDDPSGRGSFLTETKYDSPKEAIEGLHLEPYGNTAKSVQKVTATDDTFVLQGGVKNGNPPGAIQSVITDRSKFMFSTGNVI